MVPKKNQFTVCLMAKSKMTAARSEATEQVLTDRVKKVGRVTTLTMQKQMMISVCTTMIISIATCSKKHHGRETINSL